MRRQLLEHMRCLGRSDMRLAHLLAPVEWILKGWFLVHDIDLVPNCAFELNI